MDEKKILQGSVTHSPEILQGSVTHSPEILQRSVTHSPEILQGSVTYSPDFQSSPIKEKRISAKSIDLEHMLSVLEIVTNVVGCGDNSCMFVKPHGMATNGGCRCVNRPGAGSALGLFYREMVENLPALIEELKAARSRGAGMER